MPADALPVPWPQPVPGSVNYRREYRDPLGRPLTGKVTLTPVPETPPPEEEKDAATEGSAAKDEKPRSRYPVGVLPAPVVVDVHDGVLSADLPPDTYRISAVLRTREGQKVTDNDTVVLGG